ncbi:MAG TPA: NADH-quinone oxidoreductase subunit N [Chryseosolibacter sp.]
MGDQVNDIINSLSSVLPEIFLAIGFFTLLVVGMLKPKLSSVLVFSIVIFASVGILTFLDLSSESKVLFGMMKKDAFSSYVKLLICASAIFTCLLSVPTVKEHRSEYFAFLVAMVLGAHLLTMTTNFLLIFISVEILSICSYVLAGYSFNKKSAEGSLKYFLFGSVAAAVMLYGFTFLYGFTGAVDFADQRFIQNLINVQNPLTHLSAFLVLAGFLFKISSAPMHFWAPDVYDSAPAPVAAFFSTVPKLAGLVVFFKFIVAMNLFGQSSIDWQFYAAALVIMTITVGNFAALKQTNVKRMMAYSSIAQSGFLMIGLIVFLPQGYQFFLYYATVYVAMNFVVFVYINSFEKAGITTIAEYSGLGKTSLVANTFMLVGLISLTGLPPTAGFTGKLFLFSGVWSSFEQTGSGMMLVLFITGLLNTVVSLFYYLRIPYYAFLKNGKPAVSHNILPFENLLGVFLVLVLLMLFFQPGLLMSWINKINFVL